MSATVLAAVAVGCHRGDHPQSGTSQAGDVLGDLRDRLPAGVATGFDADPHGFRPHFATSDAKTEARVVLPAKSTDPLHVEDARSGLGVDVVLRGAREVLGQADGGYVAYPRAHVSGATVVHRPLPIGAEDFLSFAERPSVPAVEYQMTVGPGVKGLRLISNTLEMLDAAGTPRLRVSPPYIVGANGAQTDATLAVDGCAVDVNPVAPWDRATTPPGAATCTVRVSWNDQGVVYPAVLDPRWTTTTGALANARQDHTATVLSNGKVLVVGGRVNGTTTTGIKQVEFYDPATKTWSPAVDLPTNSARYFHTATQLPTSSNSATSGMVLIAGGIIAGATTASAKLYSVTTGLWTTATSMSGSGRDGHTATLLPNGKVLLTGGENLSASPPVLNTAEMFDPSLGSGDWPGVATNMASARKFHTATLLTSSNSNFNNRVLIVGGTTGTASTTSTNNVQVYNISAGTWSTTTVLPAARDSQTATALPGGNVLITGGRTNGTPLATALVYTIPSTGTITSATWVDAGTMTSARWRHTATLLSGTPTNVLVSGGASNSAGTALPGTAELWSSGTTWTATATPMSAAVQLHTATLLSSGAVLVAGGSNASGNAVASSQLYDPSFGQACTSSSQCVTGFCMSGVCCATTCTDQCSACNLAGSVGTCAPKPIGTTCNDGNPCTQTDTCQAGGCTGSNPKPENSFCTDGNLCTITDRCHGGVCVPGANVTCPGDACHAAGTCNPATGFCENTAPINEGLACDDGNSCTATSQCKHGVCVPEDPVTSCTGAGARYFAPLTSLGSRQGVSAANDINNHGVVAGTDVHYNFVHEFASSGEGVPFSWTPDGGIHTLPRTPGKTVSSWAISDDGEIVGTAWPMEVESPGAWVYHYDPATEQAQDSQTAGWGMGINGNGQYTGTAVFDAQGFKIYRAQGTTFQQIPIPTNQGFLAVGGRAIDASGNIVGYFQRGQGVLVAMRYTDAHGFEYLGQLLPPGSDWDIDPVLNDGSPYLYGGYGTNGTQIVGTGFTGNGKARGFVLTPSPTGAPGSGTIKRIDLPTNGHSPDNINTVVIPYRINSAGQVVGTIADTSNGPQKAFVWIDGTGTTDLNDFVDPNSGWVLTSAMGINDGVNGDGRPEIVGEGLLNGQRRAFVMRMPDVRPCPGVDICHTVAPRDPRTGTCPAPITLTTTACQEGITLRNDGVVDMGGGKFTAVFSFKNNGAAPVRPTSNEVYVAGVKLTNPQPAPPIQFPPGDHPGAFLPTFSVDQTVLWTVDGEAVSASASAPHLTPVTIGQSGIGVHVCTSDGNAEQDCSTIVTIKADVDRFKAVPDPEPPAPDEPTEGNEFLGSLDGHLTISPSGAAIYTVPITVPPNNQAMAPNLSLVYNSQGRDGIAGQGWELGGLSVIYRCPKTKAQDGFGQAIKGNVAVEATDGTGDGICMDGNRLFPQGPLSSNPIFFRSEQDGFSAISYNTDAGIFYVRTKSGETHTYNARVPNSVNFASVWLLSSVADQWGNGFNITYNGDDLGAFDVSGIRMTKIKYATQNGGAEITFGYESDDRPDIRINRFHDLVIRQNKRLKSITTPLGTYTLYYKEEDDPSITSTLDFKMLPSLLHRIQYCAGTVCLDDLTFDWDGGGYNWLKALPVTGSLAQENTYALPITNEVLGNSDGTPKYPGTQFVDLDGDGRLDLLFAREGTTPGRAWQNTGSGWLEKPNWVLPANVSLWRQDGKHSNSMLVDVDGDGVLDLVANQFDGTACSTHGDVRQCLSGTFKPGVWFNRLRYGGGWQTSLDYDSIPDSWGALDFTANGTDTLMDMDGDGLVDLVRMEKGPTGLLKVLTNTPSVGWVEPDPGRYNQEIFPITDFRLQDINRDGLPDLVPRTSSASNPVYVWVNTGSTTMGLNNSVFSPWLFPAGSVIDFSVATAVTTAQGDVDGDGFYDTVRGGNPEVPVTGAISLSTGGGYTTDRADTYLTVMNAMTPTFSQATGAADYAFNLVDVNADGLVDFVRTHRNSGGQVLINTGETWKDLDGLANWQAWKDRQVTAGDAPIVPADNFATYGDFNGDGVTDVAWKSDVYLNTFRPPVIRYFPAGLAQKTAVTYEAITSGTAKADGTYSDTPAVDADKSVFILPMRVVANTVRDNGSGGTSLTTYQYSDLRASRVGHLPQGFRTVTVIDGPSTEATRTTYLQVYPYSAMPSLVEKYRQTPLASISTTETKYCDTTAVDDTGDPLCQPSVGKPYAAQTPHFVYPISIKDTSYSRVSVMPGETVGTGLLLPEIETDTSFRYDSKGNPTRTTVTTRRLSGDGEIVSKETVNEFGDPGSEEERLGHMTTSTVTAQRFAPLDGNNAPVVHHTSFDYETRTIGDGSRRVLAKTRIEPGSYVAPTAEEPYPNSPELHIAYEYDSFGNVMTTMQCASDFAHCNIGETSADIPFRITRTSFDPADFNAPTGNGLIQTLSYGRGRFPVRKTDSAGLQEYYAYDANLGVVVQSTAPNGVHTCKGYNSYGALISDTARCGVSPLVTLTRRFRPGPTESSLTALVTVTHLPNGAATWAMSDVLGRSIGTRSRGFDGRFVETSQTYDLQGRPFVETKPHFAGETGSGEVMTYDDIGRVSLIFQNLDVIDASGKPALGLVQVFYDGLTTATEKAVNGETRIRFERKNVLGKLSSVFTENRLETLPPLTFVATERDPDEGTLNSQTMTFAYDGDGNLTDTFDPEGNNVHNDYDARGRRIRMVDPDMGEWRYAYNGFGDLIRQTDGGGQRTLMTYDQAGRLVQRTTSSGTSEWIYNASGPGIGQLATMVSEPQTDLALPCEDVPNATLTDGNRTARWVNYTQFGEVQEEFQCIDGEVFSTQYVYDDSVGRESIIRYPEVSGARFSLHYNYTRYGALRFLSDPTDESTYWLATSANALGQVTDEVARNGVETTSIRNPSTGWLMSTTSTAHADGETVIQNWLNTFDEVGNLRTRTRSDSVDGIASTETLTYDGLDRLATSQVTTADGTYNVTDSYSFDHLGNLQQKNGLDYKYMTGCSAGNRAAGPHAVCQVGNGPLYDYDGNGNGVTTDHRRIEYNAANKVSHIHVLSQAGDGQADDQRIDFMYGADGNRVVQAAFGGAGEQQERTVYVGLGATGKSVYERRVAGGKTEHTHFLYAGAVHGGNAFALRIVDQDASSSAVTTKYNHFDHLGSITATSDDVGHVVSAAWGGPTARTMGYDPWGARRATDGRAAEAASFDPPAGRRGFTGQESIPSTGLVNMNGRVYDPQVGRFLSPDPTIQFVSDLQGYNRYAYAMGNPLRYTDPTGYSITGSTWGDAAVGIGIGVLGAVACVGTEGAACIVFFTFESAIWSYSSALSAGASPMEAIMMAYAGALSGQAGGALGNAVAAGVAKSIENAVVKQLVAGAISGEISTIVSSTMMGGKLGWNMLEGAAVGALSAGLAYAAQSGMQVTMSAELYAGQNAATDGADSPRFDMAYDRGGPHPTGDGGTNRPLTPGEQAVLNADLARARAIIDRTIAALNRWNDADQANFSKWFGNTAPGTKATVLAAFQQMKAFFANVAVANYQFNPSLPAGTFAQTFPNNPTLMDLGKSYFDDIGPLARSGTLIHESTHLNMILGTNATLPETYGSVAARNLASSSPSNALMNAENWNFFATQSR